MITSADNPKVKQARALLERRGRELQGRCLAEGLRLIEDAMRAEVVPALVFYTSAAQHEPRAAALLRRSAETGVPLYELSPLIFATLSDTVNSQGLVAVLPIPAPPGPEHPSLALVLDQVRDPGNLGTILRSADAAAVGLVLLVRGTTDPWSPKALRAGMGAHFRLPIVGDQPWDAIAGRLAGYQVWLADSHGEYLYDEVNWSGPVGLILTGETSGGSREANELCRGRVAIPMPGGAESLNVAAATAILLFEIARQRRHSKDGA
jgi:RNA methyltransferase, TrmH family